MFMEILHRSFTWVVSEGFVVDAVVDDIPGEAGGPETHFCVSDAVFEEGSGV